MAIDAIRESQFLLEITVHVALVAAHFGMHSQQWVLRLRMVEFVGRHVHFMPAGGVVA